MFRFTKYTIAKTAVAAQQRASTTRPIPKCIGVCSFFFLPFFLAEASGFCAETIACLIARSFSSLADTFCSGVLCLCASLIAKTRSRIFCCAETCKGCFSTGKTSSSVDLMACAFLASAGFWIRIFWGFCSSRSAVVGDILATCAFCVFCSETCIVCEVVFFAVVSSASLFSVETLLGAGCIVFSISCPQKPCCFIARESVFISPQSASVSAACRLSEFFVACRAIC